jgi:hypothetical protein
MEQFKTPLGGFSNGTREFGLFITGKPQSCSKDSDCSKGYACDASIGFLGEPPDKQPGLTLPCSDNAAGCTRDTVFDAASAPVPGSGLCTDRTSTIWADTDFGRVGAYAIRQLVAVRSLTDPRQYTDVHEWLTNKFTNPAVRTVADFVPERGPGRAKQDYRSAGGAGGNRRVFLWGRPGFIGVNSKGSTLGLYFAYVDMPQGPGFSWEVNYYSGTGADGAPRFSGNQSDAAAVDLDASQDGIQPREIHDIVNHMSVAWVEPLGKWVMFYGGGISKFPIPELLPECGNVACSRYLGARTARASSSATARSACVRPMTRGDRGRRRRTCSSVVIRSSGRSQTSTHPGACCTIRPAAASAARRLPPTC